MDSEKKHITFVVNPISGTQEKEQIIELINEYLDIDKYTFQTLDKKLHEIDKNNLNSWCTLDIKTGFLNLTLYEDKCFENDISKINLNCIEKIIKMNF